MEKRSHGQIRTHERHDGKVTFSLRVRAYGRREVVALGTDADEWTLRKAERKLEQVLAEIQVGCCGRRARDRAARIGRCTSSPRGGGWRGSRSCGRPRRPITSGG